MSSQVFNDPSVTVDKILTHYHGPQRLSQVTKTSTFLILFTELAKHILYSINIKLLAIVNKTHSIIQ